jgi:hypothetical protein
MGAGGELGLVRRPEQLVERQPRHADLLGCRVGNDEQCVVTGRDAETETPQRPADADIGLDGVRSHLMRM